MSFAEFAAERMSDPKIQAKFQEINNGTIPHARFVINQKPPFVKEDVEYSYSGCRICAPLRQNYSRFYTQIKKKATNEMNKCQHKPQSGVCKCDKCVRIQKSIEEFPKNPKDLRRKPDGIEQVQVSLPLNP